MAENKDINNKNKDQGSNMNPFNNLTGKGKDGKPKFNFYWIYGILLIVLIGIQFIGIGDDGKQTDWRDLKSMIENHEVERIVLVNKETAEIFLKPESLNSDKHKDVSGKSGFSVNTPHYYYNVGSVDKFYEDVENAQKNFSEPVYV